MKLDVLAFGAHPDDVELACGGTLIKLVHKGLKVGVVDLTRGEMGTRGTPEQRTIEAQNAAQIMGLASRENLNMKDCLFQVDNEHILQVAAVIRKYQPEIVLANAINDRHVDHVKAAHLVHEAFFIAGIGKVSTSNENDNLPPWRAKALYHYIQDYFVDPDFCVDITKFFDLKMDSILAHGSQFFNPDSTEPPTRISGEDFLDFIEARAREMGRMVYTDFAEGFVSERPLNPELLAHFF